MNKRQTSIIIDKELLKKVRDEAFEKETTNSDIIEKIVGKYYEEVE